MNALRYERKYRVELLSLQAIEAILLQHSLGFGPLFLPRTINNIYFDSPELLAFRENVDGVPKRRKYRVRWYADSPQDVQNPQLEIKIRDNELGSKELIPVNLFAIEELAPLEEEVNKVLPLAAPLVPSLFNSYHRQYYQSFDGRFRVTLDSNLRYAGLLGRQSGFRHYEAREDCCILELKYQAQDDELALALERELPFRRTKNSKYVSGVLRCLA